MSEKGREAAFPGCGQVFTTDAQGRTLPQSAWGLEGAEGLSKRELAAMMLKVPTSGTDWLDEMILEALRTEIAAKAMQGWLANPTATPVEAGLGEEATPDDMAAVAALFAFKVADAMLAERGRK